MTDRWKEARRLAAHMWTDEEIIGHLAADLDDEGAAEVARFITAGHASLERAREHGKGLLRDMVWSIASGEDVGQTIVTETKSESKLDPVRWQALYALGRAHLGYGETHDVAQLREHIRKAKAAMRAGQKPKLMQGGKAG